jgi:hypothetical protein
LRRNEKAALDEILASARAGNLSKRAHAQTAYRLFLFREAFRASNVGVREHPSVGNLPAIEDLEMSIEEEAGSILDAEVAHDTYLLRQYYEKAHSE